MFVIDASALLAFMLDERGADAVRDAPRSSEISVINLGEVLTRLTKLEHDPAAALERICECRSEFANFVKNMRSRLPSCCRLRRTLDCHSATGRVSRKHNFRGCLFLPPINAWRRQTSVWTFA